jgi:putative redox protein
MASSMQVKAVYYAAQRFEVTSASGLTVRLDGEHQEGYSPMEMLLGCLASCSGISVISILQKKHTAVTHYEVQVRGLRAETHPLVFVEISVEHIITGHQVPPAAVERAIELAETRYCGVSIMLGKAVKLNHSYRIIAVETQ